MPTVTLPDDNYELLARKAAAVGVSPGEFIALTLGADAPEVPTKPLEGEAWRKAFEEFNRTIRATVGEYPPGFTVDVSREAMYADPRGDGR